MRGEEFASCKSHIALVSLTNCCIMIFILIKTIEVNLNTIHSNGIADHLDHRTSASFWKVFNLLMSDFGGLYSFIKCKLFKESCCSFYGSKLWILASKICCDICIAWQKALKML